jgi:hypothetical protein
VNTTISTTVTAELQGLISTKEKYPSINTGSTTTDYRTGIVTDTKNLAYDFYSGKLTKSLTSDGYGNSFIQETTPAYHQYPGMGLRTPYPGFQQAPISNKQMLRQLSATKTTKVNPTDYSILGIVSAAAQTWSDQVAIDGQSSETGIWRKKSSYSFIGDEGVGLQPDGLYPVSSFSDFTSWTDETNVSALWQKNSETTLYDVNTHELEASDVNSHFAATRMMLDQEHVIATATNSRYNEMGYSGFEEQPIPSTTLPGFDYAGGGVYSVTGADTVLGGVHTGIRALHANPGAKAFAFPLPNTSKTYHVSFWSTAADAVIKYQVDGGTVTGLTVPNPPSAAGWYLIEKDINIAATSSALIWCEAGATASTFDDFRVHPFNASMTSYVYDSWGELTYILNANNLFVNYEYDVIGRLVRTSAENLKNLGGGVTKVREITYNDAQPLMVNLTIGKTGSTGDVIPSSGVTAVRKGDNYTVQFISCNDVDL